MKAVFRTDASLQIGTGHVMRCLTLADALTGNGVQCEFMCREHHGHLIDHIRSKGYAAHSLPMGSGTDNKLDHSSWLGATWAEDAEVCASVLARLQPDWLVVDHYALDAYWESAMAPYCGRIMVIDDLADRSHDCQVLLDQTFGRVEEDYRALVPNQCTLLCGSNYALLRPEFAALRPFSLQRRTKPQLKQLLVSLGGVDKENITSQVLVALQSCQLPDDCKITVVMGATAPWLAEVEKLAQAMTLPTTVVVGTNYMAQLMADSDLAIGAAGATSWERCCLGLPTIMVVLASNQSKVAEQLATSGVAYLIKRNGIFAENLSSRINMILSELDDLARLSKAGSGIVDGHGIGAVLKQMRGLV